LFEAGTPVKQNETPIETMYSTNELLGEMLLMKMTSQQKHVTQPHLKSTASFFTYKNTLQPCHACRNWCLPVVQRLWLL